MRWGILDDDGGYFHCIIYMADANRLADAIAELRTLFEQGLHEVNQKVDDLHDDMTERFDAVDDALTDVQGVLENLTGDISRLQKETESYLAVGADDAEAQEKILEAFSDKLTARLLDSSLLRSHDLCERAQEILQERFGRDWGRLRPQSRRFLITARVLYAQMEAVPDQMDYSGVCILMLKALETELHQRFFCDYSAFMEKHHPFATQSAQWPSVLRYRDRQGKWRKMPETHFTLGSVPYFCNTCVPEHISDAVNEQDRRCLLAYAEQKLFRKGLSEAKIWEYLTRIGKDAERVTKRYRNRAAHINAIRHQEARECMDFLIDVQQVMVWMMHEFT